MEQNSTKWMHCLRFAAMSDVGLRRANNQDSQAVVLANSQEQWARLGHLFVVADGMGAHAAGELASKIATDVVPQTFFKLTGRSVADALMEAVHDAHVQIHARGQADEEFHGMGTTIDALVLAPSGAIIAHVGDSRVYRLRGRQFQQLTFDHSLVWEMRAAGQLPDGDVPAGIPRNIITRSLGPNPDVEVDLEGPFPIEPGDTFLLCSDGLSGPVDDEEMGQILASLPPDEAVPALINLAILRGGPDNVTVVVAKVLGPQVLENASAGPAGHSASRGTAPAKPVHWSVWALFIVSVAVALVTGSQGIMAGALAGGIGAATALCLAVIQRFSDSSGTIDHPGHMFGKGPYRQCQCVPEVGFAGELKNLVDELRSAAKTERWDVDWQQFNAQAEKAATAADRGEHNVSVAESCRAIGQMMGQLKRQHQRDQ